MNPFSCVSLSFLILQACLIFQYCASNSSISSFGSQMPLEGVQETRWSTQNFLFIPTAPVGPISQWPIHGKRLKKYLSLSTCIPALATTARDQLLPLLNSSLAQTVPADEIIIVVSDLGRLQIHNEALWCHQLRGLMGPWNHIRLLCVGERLSAGRARNIASNIAGGEILSFVDADDLEMPIRNEVAKKTFACNRNLKLLLHGFHKIASKMKIIDPSFRSLECNDWKLTGIFTTGDILYDQLEKTQNRLWLFAGLHHGHIIIHRDVVESVHFSSLAQGQDSVFVRDVLYFLGRGNGTSLFINMPLTSYLRANQAYKELAS